MIENYQEQQSIDKKEAPDVQIAIIGSYNSTTKTATLIFPGENEPTTKAYKCNESIEFSAGMRVRIAKISGTYVVEYPINGYQTGSDETPELADMANKVRDTGSSRGSIYFRIYHNVLQYRLNANGTWRDV